MSNTINLITEFTPMLDEKFKKESCTSILEGTLGVDFMATQNPKTVKIAKMTTSGMADYSRESGYTDGDITLAWEEHTFTNDRARRFKIDTQDLEESLLQSYAKVVAHVEKYEVAPEVDAYRFATIASTQGVGGTTGSLTSSTTKAAIDAAIAELGENEVDESNMVLFMTPTIRMNLENQLTRQLDSGVGAYDQRVYFYNGIPIISVPQTRFYSAVDLLDGKTSGQTNGGYRKHVAQSGVSGDVDGKNLNFILLAKDAVSAIIKHEVKNIIEPKYNNTSDGYLVFFRYYHDLFVKENKTNGIYVHKVS